MNTAPLKSIQPGFWQFFHHEESHYIYFNCPCGCSYVDSIRVIKPGEPKPFYTNWDWDGREDAPTLSPSIRRYTPCKFHGHLKLGVWSTEADGSPLAANVYRAGQMSGTGKLRK